MIKLNFGFYNMRWDASIDNHIYYNVIFKSVKDLFRDITVGRDGRLGSCVFPENNTVYNL